MKQRLPTWVPVFGLFCFMTAAFLAIAVATRTQPILVVFACVGALFPMYFAYDTWGGN